MVGARRKRILEMAALAVVVVGLSVYGAFAVVRHYDLANPYRDGTTHTATLDFANPSGGGVRCLQFWGASLGPYSWHPKKEPPWGTTSVTGKLHIIDSQHISEGSPFVHGAAATFTARGRTIDLSGGKRPRWSTLPCSNYSS